MPTATTAPAATVQESKSMGEHLKVKVDNKTAIVTIDHPPVNALSPAVL